MGFRNPITSATDVDTRPGTAAAGVRIYESTDDQARSYGVVEFDDGIPGDLPAHLMQTVVPRVRSMADPWGRVALDGGSYATPAGLMAAPTLSVGVEQDANSNPTPAARVRGGALSVDRPLSPLVPPARLPLNTFSAPYAGYQAPAVVKDATGRVTVTGMVAIVNAPSLAAGYVIGTLPNGCRPSGVLNFDQLGGAGVGRLWRAGIGTDGSIAFSGAASADWSFTTGATGSYLSLEGISFFAADALTVS